MLTRAQINAASPVMDDVTVQYWASLIRSHEEYDPTVHPDLVAAIEATDGDIRGQMLNALLVLVENLGPGEVKLRGGDDAIYYDRTEERKALIKYALSIIFETKLVPTIFISEETTTTTGRSINGSYGVANKDYPCSVCGLVGYHGRWCRNGAKSC